MSRHQRATSELSTTKTPHSISLKVLRLSRPQLIQQYPIPPQSEENEFRIDQAASHAHPSALNLDENSSTQFLLTPSLLLPATFGSIFVGSIFSCTLCANNELSDRVVKDVRIVAEMQHPGSEETHTIRLISQSSGDTDSDTPSSEQAAHDLAPGATLQRIVRAELPDEGVYTLAVTISYVEEDLLSVNAAGEPLTNSELAERELERQQQAMSKLVPLDAATMGRQRTFRKLYQFAAHQLLGVRTKSRVMPKISRDLEGRDTITWAVEVQLENLSTTQVVLEAIDMVCVERCRSRSLNPWEVAAAKPKLDMRNDRPPLLGSKDVLQLAYLVNTSSEVGEKQLERTNDGRIVFGQLRLRWRGAMGEAGVLNTGWLSAKAV